jgi:AcrR family transcriptional regulator
MSRKASFDRQVALNKAVELFWSRGYYASSMKHIEEALDMRPGSIYATFGSKGGLFAEALEAYASTASDDFGQAIAESSSIVEGLKCYLRSFAEPCNGHTSAQACMLIKTLLEVNAEDVVLRDRVQAMLAAFEKRLCKVLEEAKAIGELRAEVNCPRLARLLQTQIIGLRAFAERNVSKEQIAAVADDMASLIDIYRVEIDAA